MSTPRPPHESAGPGTGVTDPDWGRLAGMLRRYALALSGNAAEADDLAQQTLARLLARQAGKADHVGYARQTLTRLWLDRQRSLKRRLARLAAIARHPTAASHGARQRAADDPSGSSAQRETARQVRRAVSALPPMQRAVVVLRLIEDMDYAHIADILETSEDSVRSSLHLARKRLRTILGDLIQQ